MTSLDYHGEIMQIMRPSLGSARYRVTDLIKILAPLKPHQLEAIGEIVIERANAHDRLAVKLLRYAFPELHIHTNFTPALRQIYSVMEAVVQRGKHDEGIFRLSKNIALAEGLATRILAEEEVDLSNIITYDLAIIIKTFTKQAFPHLIKLADLENFRTTENISLYLEGLTPVRRHYLGQLALMARAIAAEEATNRMSLSNLARVFAPNMHQDANPVVEFHWINTTIKMVERIFQAA